MMPLPRRLQVTLAVLLAAGLTGGAVLTVLWQTRANPADIPLQLAAPAGDAAGKVTVTWLGISTLLFDDGETQILTDATFSRFGVARLLLLPVRSDIARINYMIDEYRMNRVSAIVPLHSHFDHAMDAGHVANRTGAVVLGSESSANVARGSSVPVDQYQILDFGESRYFGNFTITLLESRHAPLSGPGDYWFPGIIAEPLVQPARVHKWQGGATYSLLLSHPSGTALVVGSAGYVDGTLDAHAADVAFLSIAGLSALGRDYTERYWRETVGLTGATRVFPVHFDDFTQPYDEIALFPDIVDDVVTTGGWLHELADASETPVTVRLPRYGEPVVLY